MQYLGIFLVAAGIALILYGLFCIHIFCGFAVIALALIYGGLCVIAES